MKLFATMTATLLALAAPVWAQQSGKDQASDTVEIRAYLLNKERATINIVGVTAVLIVESKEGKEVLIPLQVITTKTGEKHSLQTFRAPRELEGTSNQVSLIRVPVETKEKPAAAPSDNSKPCFILDGPYFSAELTREQLAGFTCQASVRFTMDGTIHSARGFSCAFSQGSTAHGTHCHRIAEDCKEIERLIKANDMAKAGVAVDRMSAELCGPCSDAKCGQAQHGCKSCCTELRAAVTAGSSAKALEALEAFKAKCSSCASAPKAESKP